jgi:hypothetical protein
MTGSDITVLRGTWRKILQTHSRKGLEVITTDSEFPLSPSNAAMLLKQRLLFSQTEASMNDWITSLGTDLSARTLAITCTGIGVWHCSQQATHYKRWCAFINVNNVFKENSHHSRCSKYLPSAHQQTWQDFLSLQISTDLSASREWWWSSSNVWGLLEYTFFKVSHI